MDLGIGAFRFLIQEDQVAGMLERAAESCQRLEAKRSLDATEQHQYAQLLSALAATGRPRMFADGVKLFQDNRRFFDYPRYRTACHLLDGFYQLLSAVHFPTSLSAAGYPTATMLKTLDQVLAHRAPEINPYIRYYESEVIPRLAADPPPVVGISMVFTNQTVNALVLGHLIKERFPGIHVVLGGAFLSQWVMVAGDDELAQLFSCADSIICGEGERPLTELLARVQAKAPIDGIPNLVRLDPDSGKPLRFDEMIYTDVTEQPPPDFSDLDLDLYLTPKKIIPYSISRGCYWGRCVFCQNRYGDYHMRRYQTVPVEKALREMSDLAERYQTDHFNFSNDVIDPAYLKKFSRAVLDSGKSFIWNTDLRAESAFDAETCRLMADAGLNSVAIGFESGCQKTLDAMDKGNRTEVTREVMKNLYQAGVATQAMGIFGFPGESEADGHETVQFIEENTDRISYYVMGLLMVLPGSKMHETPDAYGVTSISYDTNPLKTPEPVWTSATRMSIDSVNRLYQRLNRLEELYAVGEYPYVGGLCTNHGFLYYHALGPNVLKMLRTQEEVSFHRLLRELGQDGGRPSVKTVRNRIPRLVLPCRVYRSCYPADRLPGNEDRPVPPGFTIAAGTERDYLISSGHSPVPIGPVEADVVGAINGKRSLKVLLKQVNPTQSAAVLKFLWSLILMDLLALEASARHRKAGKKGRG
jgi:radical SAM superfamily enzyme YgiQ (UPF0313 family)